MVVETNWAENPPFLWKFSHKCVRQKQLTAAPSALTSISYTYHQNLSNNRKSLPKTLTKELFFPSPSKTICVCRKKTKQKPSFMLRMKWVLRVDSHARNLMGRCEGQTWRTFRAFGKLKRWGGGGGVGGFHHHRFLCPSRGLPKIPRCYVFKATFQKIYLNYVGKKLEVYPGVNTAVTLLGSINILTITVASLSDV